MKITLTNGAELFPIIVTGERKRVYGSNRDTLSFVFPQETSLDEMDAIFTAENCKRIILTEDNVGEYIHDGYTLRAELCRQPVVIEQATDETEEVVEHRVIVSMAQRTPAENQVKEMEKAMMALAGVEV